MHSYIHIINYYASQKSLTQDSRYTYLKNYIITINNIESSLPLVQCSLLIHDLFAYSFNYLNWFSRFEHRMKNDQRKPKMAFM